MQVIRDVINGCLSSAHITLWKDGDAFVFHLGSRNNIANNYFSAYYMWLYLPFYVNWSTKIFMSQFTTKAHLIDNWSVLLNITYSTPWIYCSWIDFLVNIQNSEKLYWSNRTCISHELLHQCRKYRYSLISKILLKGTKQRWNDIVNNRAWNLHSIRYFFALRT